MRFESFQENADRLRTRPQAPLYFTICAMSEWICLWNSRRINHAGALPDHLMTPEI